MSYSIVYMSNTSFANRKLADKAKIFPTSLVKNGYKNLFGGEIIYRAMEDLQMMMVRLLFYRSIVFRRKSALNWRLAIGKAVWDWWQ